MDTFVGKSCRIHHNSDLSGKAIITIPSHGTSKTIEVLAEDLLDFIAEFVRGERISKLEQASTKEILGI